LPELEGYRKYFAGVSAASPFTRPAAAGSAQHSAAVSRVTHCLAVCAKHRFSPGKGFPYRPRSVKTDSTLGGFRIQRKSVHAHNSVIAKTLRQKQKQQRQSEN